MAEKVTTSSHKSVSTTGTHLSLKHTPRENTARTGVITRTGAHEAIKGQGGTRTGSFTATRLSTGITAALGVSSSGLHEAVKPAKPPKPKMSPAKKRRIYIITVVLTAIMIIAAAFTLNSTTKSAKYNNYLQTAYSQYENGEYDAALTNLRKASAIHASDETYILMANCYAKEENYDKAIEVLRSLNTSDKTVQNLIAEYQSSREKLLNAGMINILGMQFEPGTSSAAFDGMNLGNDLINRLTVLYGMTSLSVSGNGITDISGLSALGGLVSLDLSDNNISDISALEALPSLRLLNLDNNPVFDLSPLYSLPELSMLSIKGIDLNADDLSALSSALPGCAIITDTDETENAGITLGGVSFSRDVTEIDLSGLGISDISVLSACSSLTEIILDGNNITDISPLMDIPGLEHLSIRGNCVSDLRPLIALNSINYLDVSDNEINSVVALGSLTEIKTLILDGNEIFDFSGVSKLTSLENLSLKNTGLSDENLPEFYTMANLKFLNIEDNENVSGEGYDKLAKTIYGCVIKHGDLVYSVDFAGEKIREDVTELVMNGKGITDISALNSFTNLKVINLSGNNISNIYILRYLNYSPEWIDLSSNNIEDATVVSALYSVKHLDLSYNSISSLNPFVTLTGLEYLNLTGNKLTEEQVNNLRGILTGCEIVF